MDKNEWETHLLDSAGNKKPIPESGNEWSQPIGVFDTTQFPADKSEELEVLQAENKKLKEEQSLTEVHDFLKRFADEFHVWSYGKNGGGQGERFKSYQEADEYYRHLASGPCSHVTLEAHLTLKEKKLNQNPIKSPNPLLDVGGSGKLLPESGSESKHAETLAEKLVSLEAENKRLRSELEVYANPEHWMRHGAFPAAKWFRKATGVEDGGVYAREALSEPTPTTGILKLAAAAAK